VLELLFVDQHEGVFGKPQGVCAQVVISQVMLFVRCKDVATQHAQKTLR
jgi:ribosomal protein L16/L10AE